MNLNTLQTACRILILTSSTLAFAQSDPLQGYSGPSNVRLDNQSLTGKVMVGYQGWFNCEGDGMKLGWTHWAKNRSKAMGPQNVAVDLWPDIGELTPEERFPTEFQLPDGSRAEVFSSANRQTVLRHFRWMRDHAIDGAFVQRFANGLRSKELRTHKDVVLAHCREGANREGRVYAVMYDLSGIGAGDTHQVIADWRLLRTEMKIGSDPAYQHLNGKPLVAVWGIGFNDGRAYSLKECRELVEFFRADGCAVMLGVPTGWRELHRDATNDRELHAICKLADVLSPWTVGRYQTTDEATRHGMTVFQPDIQWCQEHSKEYLPVIFAGFSWHNLKPGAPLGQIPRRRGEFLWSQFVAAKKAGAQMIYVAMFDEVDEGTAIFKCTNSPPQGPSEFLTYEGLPSDHYLWLTGAGGKMLRDEIPLTVQPPQRSR
jgi:hypothetical protein